jgi:hypothetical protein
MLTVDKVKNGIYTVGFYPALVYLKKQEDLENYKECEIIKEALDQTAYGREWYLSSKVEGDSLKKSYEKIISSRPNSKILDSNMPYYIEKFAEMMKVYLK